MPPITDALELLTAQHEQIDDLYDLVATLRDGDALTELADTLTAHLGAEQELLYPKCMPRLARHIHDELVAEHREIKRVLADLIWSGVEDPDFATKLDELRTLLDGHAAYQEDELFTRAAATMSRSQLAAIGAEIVERATVVYQHAPALAS